MSSSAYRMYSVANGEIEDDRTRLFHTQPALCLCTKLSLPLPTPSTSFPLCLPTFFGNPCVHAKSSLRLLGFKEKPPPVPLPCGLLSWSCPVRGHFKPKWTGPFLPSTLLASSTRFPRCRVRTRVVKPTARTPLPRAANIPTTLIWISQCCIPTGRGSSILDTYGSTNVDRPVSHSAG
eukprot:3027936-Pleurochrysis_carterae.AAC.1